MIQNVHVLSQTAEHVCNASNYLSFSSQTFLSAFSIIPQFNNVRGSSDISMVKDKNLIYQFVSSLHNICISKIMKLCYLLLCIVYIV